MTQETTPQERKINMKVIALAVICIILAASLVGVIALYQPNSQLAEKDATINSLTAQITDLQARLANTPNGTTYTQEIAYLNQQILSLEDSLASMNDTLTSVTSDNAGYVQILNLELSGLLYEDSFAQDANTTTTLWNDQIDYAGYVVVDAQVTANTTYAQVMYSFGDYSFNYNQTVGTTGTAVFAVLPGTLQVLIGNLNQTATNNVNATVTYYY